MDSFYLSARIIFPVFVTVLLGYLLKRFRFWDEHTLEQLNKIVFRVLFPATLFSSVMHTDLKSTLNERLLIVAAVVVIVQYILVTLVVKIFVKDRKRYGAMAQAVFRGNTLLFGMPMVTTIYGPESAGTAALVIAVVIPIYNALTVVLLEGCRGSRANIKTTARGIVTNPLILGTVAGLIFLVAGWRLPTLADEALGNITKITTPLALMALGGSFQFGSLKKNRKAICFTSLGRLVFVPLLFVPIMIWMGFRGVELAALLSVLAVPVAVTSYTMAVQMDSDSELAAQLVVFTSIGATFTVFGWIFALSQLGYL